MDQDKQTLLEAAKAALFGARFDSGGVYLNLRDAIAREEAKPATDAQVDYQDGRAAWWRIRANEANDRAKKAEADAEWHRKESARLSAELAREREENRTNNGYLARVREEVGVHPLDTVYSLRQRAEKAEAELEERRADGVVAAQDACDLRARAMRAEAKLARVGKQLARLVELQVNPPIAVTQPFEGDPQTCAFGSNAFRGNREVAEPTENNDDPVDPVTGWTFDTYRRVVEALGGKS